MKTVTIEPHLSFQNYEHFKRLTLDSPDSQIEFLEGFEFEWGYTYTLSVNEKKLKSTWSDGTQYEYTFNRIKSKIKESDSTVFRLFLDGNRYYHKVDSNEINMNTTLKQQNDSVYLYFDKVEIEFPIHLKNEMQQIASRDKTRLGYFKYVNGKRIRLIHF